MKIGIIGILNNPATSENSHSAGMVNVVSKLFNADILSQNDNWNEYDNLIIYHGVNFKPNTFNIIGGINDEILFRAKLLSEYIGNIYSLDGFQLNEFSIKRKLNLYNNHKYFDIIQLPDRNNLVIGDSHSISVWQDDSYTLSRNDGKTLYGFLKEERNLTKYNNIIFYFGNIDVRFHLGRQSNPIQATKELFTKYCEYVSKYNATLVELLPIEDESRKIPKSGMYKGKPYYGNIELRKEIRNTANEIMFNSGLNILRWPSFFTDEKGNLKFEIMEPKQSVHIKPKYYIKNINNKTNILWKLL
jgi:hypothetical protein